MSDDLVERLREPKLFWSDLCNEAADEIERLRTVGLPLPAAPEEKP